MSKEIIDLINGIANMAAKPSPTQLVSKWVTEAGLDAYILFVNGSHHCGYVRPPDNLVNMGYDDVPVVVHGGLTYSGGLSYANNEFVFGYDCAHSGDKTAYIQHGTFRDIHYCTKQCESLATQLMEYSSSITSRISE